MLIPFLFERVYLSFEDSIKPGQDQPRRGDGRRRRKPPCYVCGSSKKVGGESKCPGVTITVHKIDALVWEEIGVYLEKLDKIVEKLKMRVTKMVGQINPDVIDQQIQEIEEEMTQINREKRGKHGKARELAENDIVSLQEKLDELEALKQVAVKKLETIGQEQRDIEWLLHWGKEFAGRYNEAKYDDKRDALRILGIVAKVYRVEDTEHPRYEITTSISANIATTSHARWL